MPKLLLILLATGLFVDFTVGCFYRVLFSNQAHAALHHNLTHYGHLLAKEIGNPPDTAKARVISDAYSLHIQTLGPSGHWNSSPKSEGQEAGTKGFLGPGSNVKLEGTDAGELGWRHGQFLVRVKEGEGEFLFVTDFRQLVNRQGAYLALLILIVSLVFGAAFMAIRRLLSPLKSLSEAVERLGRGELGHQVPVCSHDEFGSLASSFNTMSSRLAALVRAREQLLLDVSHELRSPLTRIKVALELAPEGTDTEGIGDDLNEMETMIGEILEAARLDSVHGKLNLEEMDLRELVSEAVAATKARPPGAVLVESNRNQLGRPTTLSRNKSGSMLKIDRARVRKVLTNVLDNAIKFSKGKGVPVEVRIEEGDTQVTIHVRDWGVGIPETELTQIFEPFYRIDRSRSRETGGYGLGLSLCKRIMEAHGGQIGITSQAGEGTQVSLVFPL